MIILGRDVREKHVVFNDTDLFLKVIFEDGIMKDYYVYASEEMLLNGQNDIFDILSEFCYAYVRDEFEKMTRELYEEKKENYYE